MGNTSVREKEQPSSRQRYDSGPTMVSKHIEESPSDGLSVVKVCYFKMSKCSDYHECAY